MRKASLFGLDCLWQSSVNPCGPSSSQCHDLSKWAAQSSWVPCHSPKLLTHRSPFMASAAGHVSAPTPAQEGCKQLAPSISSCASPSLSPVQLGLPTPCQTQQANKSSYCHCTGQPGSFWLKEARRCTLEHSAELVLCKGGQCGQAGDDLSSHHHLRCMSAPCLSWRGSGTAVPAELRGQ